VTNYICTNGWLYHFKNHQIKKWKVNGKKCTERVKNVTAFKFRGKKYVGEKASGNYVMDLRCLNVAGTTKNLLLLGNHMDHVTSKIYRSFPLTVQLITAHGCLALFFDNT